MVQISERQRTYRSMRASYAASREALWRRIEALEAQNADVGWAEQDELSKRLLLLYRMVSEMDFAIGEMGKWC